MIVDPHDLAHEFPEHAPSIEELRARDARFSRLFDDYHAVNGEVVALEERDVPIDDLSFETLKKERLRLKDAIYEILRARSPR